MKIPVIEECKKALQSVKYYVKNLPYLAIPRPRETLYLYITTSAKAVSAVLVQEREGRQHPIYFVSRALHDAEVIYSPLKKAVLALVHAARKLKPYFQSYVICAITDLPLRQILHKSEASEQLMKWVIELGEHEIHYLPRKAIKGQTLADFLVELKEEANRAGCAPAAPQNAQPPAAFPNLWQLWVDGVSQKGQCGASILLISFEGEELSYAF